MTMSDYVWPCTTKYDYVCLCLTTYDYVWLCMNMYDYVWLCFQTMLKQSWLCFILRTFAQILCLFFFEWMSNPIWNFVSRWQNKSSEDFQKFIDDASVLQTPVSNKLNQINKILNDNSQSRNTEYNMNWGRCSCSCYL